MSINRKNAISQKTSFLSALKGEKVEVMPGVAVYTTASSDALVGVMVPKKAVALSVDRHRLKRRIAAIVAANPLANTMVVVRVLKKIDVEVDLTKLQSWFDEKKKLENVSSSPSVGP